MAVIETNRLYLRKLAADDKDDLMKVLSDPDSMRYYPHPLSVDEVDGWIRWSIENYKKYGHGLWAVILKDGDIFIGDCGITMQDIDGEVLPEIGFHIIKDYCNKGYATEAASACRDYAFNILNYEEIYSYTTVENLPSRRVAQKIGMHECKQYEKNGLTHVVHKIIKPTAISNH